MPRPAHASRRGGRRPGAGAPRGNLNALKTGARSQQFKALIIALLAVPDTRRVLMHLSRMEHRRRVLLQDAINHGACPELAEGLAFSTSHPESGQSRPSGETRYGCTPRTPK